MQRFILVFCMALFCAGPAFSQGRSSGIEEDINLAIQRIESNFPFKIAYRNIPQSASDVAQYEEADEADYPQVYKILNLFEDEIKKYPAGFFENSRLEQIYLVKKFFFAEHPTEGLYSDQYRIIFLGIDRGLNRLRKRHNIHHELFHMIEDNLRSAGSLNESEWSKLNGKGFVYGQQKVSSNRKATITRSTPPRKGFVTQYAMSKPQEDRAEIFACLMIRSQHNLLSNWMETDIILRKKVNFIKGLVYNYSNGMDPEYWAGLFSHLDHGQ